MNNEAVYTETHEQDIVHDLGAHVDIMNVHVDDMLPENNDNKDLNGLDDHLKEYAYFIDRDDRANVASSIILGSSPSSQPSVTLSTVNVVGAITKPLTNTKNLREKEEDKDNGDKFQLKSVQLLEGEVNRKIIIHDTGIFSIQPLYSYSTYLTQATRFLFISLMILLFLNLYILIFLFVCLCFIGSKFNPSIE